jgi:hypothetical protein
VGTDPWMAQVRTQGTAGGTRDSSGAFGGVNSVSLVSSTAQPFQHIINNLVPSRSISWGHPSSEFFLEIFFAHALTAFPVSETAKLPISETANPLLFRRLLYRKRPIIFYYN